MCPWQRWRRQFVFQCRDFTWRTVSVALNHPGKFTRNGENGTGKTLENYGKMYVDCWV